MRVSKSKLREEVYQYVKAHGPVEGVDILRAPRFHGKRGVAEAINSLIIERKIVAHHGGTAFQCMNGDARADRSGPPVGSHREIGSPLPPGSEEREESNGSAPDPEHAGRKPREPVNGRPIGAGFISPPAAPESPPRRRGRGRPPGSKNKSGSGRSADGAAIHGGTGRKAKPASGKPREIRLDFHLRNAGKQFRVWRRVPGGKATPGTVFDAVEAEQLLRSWDRLDSIAGDIPESIREADNWNFGGEFALPGESGRVRLLLVYKFSAKGGEFNIVPAARGPGGPPWLPLSLNNLGALCAAFERVNELRDQLPAELDNIDAWQIEGELLVGTEEQSSGDGS